jgi:hypothetical protein
MSQSRINTFFTSAIDSEAYEAQLQRTRLEHAASTRDREERAMAAEARSALTRRRPGRPRKTVNITNNITVTHSTVQTIHIEVIDESLPSSPSSSSASSPSPPPPSPAPPPSTSSTASSSSSPSSPPSSPPPPTKKRRNWLQDAATVGQIVEAVKSHKSVRAAVEALQNNDLTAKTFAGLNESTVRGWFYPSTFRLRDDVLERLQRKGVTERTGRRAVMDGHEDLEQWVVDRITRLRTAGGVVNSAIVHAFFLGLLKFRAPHLIQQYSISRRWVRDWMRKTMALTYRKGTSSGQKLPLDWEDQVKAMAKRVSAAAARYDITNGCFIINFDQTAVQLMQTSKYTYESQGAKQVPITGGEDRRQITVVVGSTLDGGLLPLQLIFEGQEHNKKQRRALPHLSELVRKRVTNGRFHLTQTPSHWSTLDSMQDYIRVVVDGWVKRRAHELGVRDPHCVLLLDCWSVHISQPFRDWMARHFPRYHLVYVPANCTSKAQPADVMLQRPFKNAIVRTFTAWMSDQIGHHINLGENPDTLRVDTTLSRLKPLLVDWTWQSWIRLFDKTDLIKEGWRKSGLGEVLNAAEQREAMRFCMNTEEPALEEEVAERNLGCEVDDLEEEEEGVEV